MADTAPRLALLTPHGIDAGQADAIVEALAEACGAADVAAVVLRLAPSDERGLVNLAKRLAPPAQEHGAAVVVACPGYAGDLVTVAARGGADGVHAEKAGEKGLRDLRARLRDGRVLGAGGVLESRHAAMEAGEAGVDYVMFGGLYPDGGVPDPDLVRERAQWWAEIFETPCIAVAAAADDVALLARTGAEFVGLESALWLGATDTLRAAAKLVRDAGDGR